MTERMPVVVGNHGEGPGAAGTLWWAPIAGYPQAVRVPNHHGARVIS
ncbi:hypothetical protein [Kocuria soli]|nr:hypothetical protein [Kocuria soli]